MAVLALSAALDADPRSAALAGAAVAVALAAAGVAVGRAEPLPVVLVLLVTLYVAPEGDRPISAPLFGGAMLLAAELASWSLDERIAHRADPGLWPPRLLAILGVVAVGAVASALVLAAADTDVDRTAALTAAGAAAAVGCVALLVALARRSR